MKNYLLLMLYCILSMACVNKKENETVNYKLLSDIEADKIVAYNNMVVELTDEQTAYLSRIEGSLTRIQEGLENPDSPTAFLAILPMFSNVSARNDDFTPTVPPKEMGVHDQTFFRIKIAAMNTYFEEMKVVFNTLNDYIKAEDYKDDNSSKGFLLIDSIYKIGDSYYETQGNMLRKLKVIGDDAELVLLKTDPLKDYIYTLKADRKAIGEFYDLLANGAKDYHKIESQAKTKFEYLEKMQKQNSKINILKIKDVNGKQLTLINFYDRFKELLIIAKRIMRNAAETGKVSELALEDLANQEEAMRNLYNNFVD